MRIMVLVWLILVVGAFVLHSMNEARTAALREDLQNTNSSIAGLRSDVEAGRPQLQAELDRARQESTALAERLVRLETVLGDEGGLDERVDEAQSERAVRQAKLADLAAQGEAASRHLGKLKSLQTDWAATEAAVLRGEPGRRIAASPEHFAVAMDIFLRERPTAQQIVRWEQQLTALTAPVTQAAADKTVIAITDEHATLLSDLGQQLAKAANDFEQQKLLLDSLQRETSSVAAGNITFAQAMAEHRARLDQAEAERISAAKREARLAAEKEQATRVATLEREVVEAKTKREEERLRAEKAREEQLARLEQEQIAEEARVEEAKRQAVIAGLHEEATRVEEALRWAQLEREMARDMEAIRGHLIAFTADGFKHRTDDVRGPASFSQIQGSGALESTQSGMQKMLWLACASNDRPRGALPEYIGGNVNWNVVNSVPVEKTQALLKKYGELMVRKGMLAP